MYLRENDFSRFDPGMMLYNLKVLDLCLNRIVNVDFLHLLPQLRHLYLTGNCIESFEGFHDLEELETLCLSNNRIPSFEGLGMLPNLRILSVNHNLISDYKFFPFLPSLYVLNLQGNPLTSNDLYRKLAIAVGGNELARIDNVDVAAMELEETGHYRGKIAFCITEGFMAEESGFSVAEQADKFLLTKQRESTRQHSLVLQHIHLETGLIEGHPVTLQVCLQDRRLLSERKATKFQSNQIYPVELTVQGEANQVLLVGSMNNWREPLELEKCTEAGNVFFHTTLYLPPGEYEYRYIVDGEEKVSEHAKTVSKYNDTVCNMYKVTGMSEELDLNSSTLLHIRWLRSNANSGFDLIEGENSLTHVPGLKDVGACLRAEVLSYLNGQFEALVFDITPPIICGVPTCSRLELQGDPVESGELTVLWSYTGGQESGSTFQWTRISSTGKETALQVNGPVYRVNVQDVGNKLKVAYTPRREDGVSGDTRIVFSPTIVPAPPVARSFSMAGSFVEGERIVLETEYYGGREGPSRFTWFRQKNGGYDPIPGATGRTYTPTVEDLGTFLTAEYVPVSDDGRQGDAVRTDSPPILAGRPKASVRLLGDFRQGGTVALEVLYCGGRQGVPIIQWYRMDPGGNAMFFLPPNPLSYVIGGQDEGCTIGVQYTPVRSDGVRGETFNVHNPNPVGSGFKTPMTLRLKPNPLVEGNVAELDIDVNGQIEWLVSDEQGQNFRSLDHARNTRSITLTQNEVMRKLRVVYIPNLGGADGPKMNVETGFVQPGPPQARQVQTVQEGKSFRGAFVYSGGVPGTHTHRWLKVGPDGQETTLTELVGPMSTYSPVADDVGCQLKYSVRPTRSDGTLGEWTPSAPTATIKLSDLPVDEAVASSGLVARQLSMSSLPVPSQTAAQKPFGSWGAGSWGTPAAAAAPQSSPATVSSWKVPVATTGPAMGAWGPR